MNDEIKQQKSGRVAQSRAGFRLSLETSPHKSTAPARNPDPYNSSGSFDRTKNWARVGKR